MKNKKLVNQLILKKSVQNELIHNVDDGELKIERIVAIDRDGLFWGKGKSAGGGGSGGSIDADNDVNDREKVITFKRQLKTAIKYSLYTLASCGSECRGLSNST